MKKSKKQSKKERVCLKAGLGALAPGELGEGGGELTSHIHNHPQKTDGRTRAFKMGCARNGGGKVVERRNRSERQPRQEIQLWMCRASVIR